MILGLRSGGVSSRKLSGLSSPCENGMMLPVRLERNKRKIPIIPDILCNSGGVIVSYYEWIQNISNESWTKEKVFDKLDTQMIDCFTKIKNLEDYDLYRWRNLCYQYSVENIYKVYSSRKSYLFS